MKKQNFFSQSSLRKSRQLLGLIFALGVIFLVNGAFGKKDPKSKIKYGGESQNIRNLKLPPLVIPSFKMHPDIAKTIIDRGVNKQKIILKLFYKPEETASINEMKLNVFWAKNQERHGQPESGYEHIGPWLLEPLDTAQPLKINTGDTVILGNNYLMVSVLKKTILLVPKGETLSFIKFSPEIRIDNPNHLVFSVWACTEQGSCYTLPAVTGTTTTKPSPPAPPGP